MATPALPPGWSLVAFGDVGSTNDEAMAAAEAGAPEGAVFWARRQLAGRGRRGRGWESPEGNLHCSVVVRPACPAERAAQLGFVAALAVADTVAGWARPDIAVALKWPNDVLVDGAKISGILLEAAVDGAGTATHIVIGTGVNLRHRPPADSVSYRTTSVAGIGAPPSVEDALSALCAALASRIAQWRGAGFAATRGEWLARAHPVGTGLVARTAEGDRHGRFAGLDPAGALLLEEADGVVRKVSAGEVFPSPR